MARTEGARDLVLMSPRVNRLFADFKITRDATPDTASASLLLDTLDGAEFFDVRFRLTDREGLRAKLVVDTP
ncbi:MAG: hypothetical protein ABR507_03320 [Actinomycetota bacterium]|nr:hypothetical protein [Actinomycetota bacterium]